MKKAVFSGSFDPITKGHENIVMQAATIFDEVVVAIGCNNEKKNAFSVEQRMKWIEQTFAKLPNVKVAYYEGLTVDFCEKINASYIIRGIRTAADFDYESVIAEANKKLNPDITTVFFMTEPHLRCVSSTVVRDLIKHNAPLDGFLPEGISIDVK